MIRVHAVRAKNIRIVVKTSDNIAPECEIIPVLYYLKPMQCLYYIENNTIAKEATLINTNNIIPTFIHTVLKGFSKQITPFSNFNFFMATARMKKRIASGIAMITMRPTHIVPTIPIVASCGMITEPNILTRI